MTTSARSDAAVKVWDLPTRLFHWCLVLGVISAFVARKFGDSMLVWHMTNGYFMLVLIVFRLLWGFFGSTTARFGAFLTGPGAVIAYLRGIFRGEHRSFVGHNPAGGWSVVALLTILAMQGVTGLFASDDILAKGPLAFLVSERTVAFVSTLHRWSAFALIALVMVHVGAVLFHLKQGDNLIVPMITGCKPKSCLPPGTRAVQMRGNLLALALFALAGVVVWLAIASWKW
ncbi:MAG: cytochrome b/b6 domain-containing protein [Magnetococcales bacterium]|nr:cytochrome b/b6 domain-containing protein [Magnetococcales bacterium]